MFMWLCRFLQEIIFAMQKPFMQNTKKLLIVASVVLATLAYAGKQWHNIVLQHPAKPCSKSYNVANCQFFDKYAI